MHVIDKLLHSSVNPASPFPLSEFEVIQLCLSVRQIFLQQPMLLELCVPLNICGDLHGQFGELCKIFQIGGHPNAERYLFLGDYVDRGDKQLETICLMFAYKIAFPQTFHMLRGNHECREVCSQYGFLDECMRVFSANIFELFISCFDVMPVAAIVERKMFCVHGGISPELTSMDQIKNLPRPSTIPESGLLCDLVWSDPDIMTHTWAYNSSRGTSVRFGVKNVVEFLRRFSLDIIVRAHEVVPEGYQFFAGLGLLTLFSSTNFGTNHAVFIKINEALHCTFHNIA
jgi:serine/threonine-protein phosphatase PP1 catalytic subunit